MKTKGILALISLCWSALSGVALAAPYNDDFPGALVSGLSGTLTGQTNVAATEQATERTPFDDSPNSTVWYSWTAPADGDASFDVIGANFDTIMAVYSDNALPTGTTNLLGENDDFSGTASKVSFTAVSGTTYRIQVAGFSGETGNFPLHWSFTPIAPGNLQFSATATSTPDDAGTVSIEVDRVNGSSGAVSVGYSTAPGTATDPADFTGGTGTVNFADGETQQFITIPIVNHLTFQNPKSFTITLGNPLTGGATLGTPVQTTVTILSHLPPPNDNFANAQSISLDAGNVIGSDFNSTSEGGVEDSTLGAVVWYKWVAPSSGAVAFTVKGTPSHFVEILRGPGFPALQFVSEQTLRHTAAINIVAGTTYYIAVGGGQDAFDLAWQTTTTGVFELAGFRKYYDPNTGLTSPRFVAGESGGSVAIVVRRVGALTGTASVELNAVADTPDEFPLPNATAGSDFTMTGVNVIFNPGESVKTVSVPILNDTDVEPTEDLLVSLSGPTAGAVLGNVSRAQLQLFDDENDPVNDDLANAQAIFGPSGEAFGDNLQADPEPTEPVFTDDAAGNTIWYRWVAPLAGTTEFSAEVDDGTGPVDAIVDVFASGVTGLTLVASSAANPRFEAVPGQAYLVRVDSSASAAILGQTTLQWSIATGGEVSFLVDSFKVRETNADVMLPVTIQRSGAIENGATVDIVTVDNTAVADVPGAPGDYAPFAQTIIFNPGETSKTVNITIHGDPDAEGDEFFDISLRSPTGALITGSSTASVQIDDDDDDPANDAFANRVALTPAGGSQAGTNVGAGTETGEPAHGFNSVWYSWTPGSAALATVSLNGSSFMSYPTVTVYTGTAVSGLTRVAQGYDGATFVTDAATTYVIAVTEGDEFGSPSTFTLDYSLNATGSLISVASTDVSVGEEAGNLVITLTRSGSTAGVSTVDFSTFDDTAVAPGDYTTSTGTVTFNATETTKTITVPIVTDSLVEGDESFFVTLSNVTGSILNTGDPTDIFVTILDNDDDPVAASNDNFANAATLSGNSPIVAGYSDGATTETNEPGSPSRTLWYQWSAPATGVAVASIGDAEHTFNIYTGTALTNLAPVSYLSGTSFATTSGTTYFVQVNWTGDGSPNFVFGLNFTNAGVLSVVTSGLVVNENGGSATVTVQRLNGSNGAVSVRFRTVGITATAGADFTSVDTIVNFANGVTSQTVNVPILNDAELEGDETVRLVLSDPTGGALVSNGATEVIALAINDDEDNPNNDNFANAVALSGPFGSTGDNNVGASRETGEPIHASAGTGASIWFRWTAPATGTVTFTTTGSTIPTALGAYSGAAVNALTELGSNAGNPSSVSFAAVGGASYALAIDSSDSSRGEVTLNWNLVLPGVISFSPTTYTTAEGNSNVVLTVTRAVGSDGAVSVHFATADGTATAGQDYTATSGDLNFANGETSKTITVSLLNDTAFEIGESFTVVLTAPMGGASLGAATTATVTMSSNDPFTPSAVNFAALVNPGGAHATAGLLTLTETATASFTGKLLLGGTTFSLKGSFDAFGGAVITIPRKGLATLAVAIQLDDGGQTIAGHVYDGSFDSAFTGEASFYDGKNRLYPQPGPFTLALLPTSAVASVPQGFGSATMTVGTNGVFTIKGGQLGDANTLSATGFIAQSGQAQFYSLLYSGKGSLSGVVNFRNLAQTDADGTLRWFKPANAPKQKYFLNGFDTPLNLNASFFTKPAPNTRIDSAFDANNGDTDVTLRDGNLAAPLAFNGLLDVKNKLTVTTPVPLTLTGNSKTGQFTGSFTPLGGKKTSFKGVFLQKSDRALGQFFGVSLGGGVTVVPH